MKSVLQPSCCWCILQLGLVAHWALYASELEINILQLVVCRLCRVSSIAFLFGPAAFAKSSACTHPRSSECTCLLGQLHHTSRRSAVPSARRPRPPASYGECLSPSASRLAALERSSTAPTTIYPAPIWHRIQQLPSIALTDRRRPNCCPAHSSSRPLPPMISAGSVAQSFPRCGAMSLRSRVFSATALWAAS